MIDVEWTVTHYARVDLEAIKKNFDQQVKFLEPNDALAVAIGNEIAGLDDGDYYAWTDEATEQVRQAFMREYGIQTSLFDEDEE